VKGLAGIKPWFIKEPTTPDMYIFFFFFFFLIRFIVLALCACYTSTFEINYHFADPTLVFFSREQLVTLLILVVGGCGVVWRGFLVAPRGGLMPQRAVVSYR